MTIPHVLSIIFSVASAIYIFIGIYVIYLDPRRQTNILFFSMAMSCSIWAFGFSMSIAADTLSIVLFWRRFAALGFGAFYSVLLHFFIVFTSHEAVRCRRRFFLLLYSPAIIVYLGFTYFPKLNPEQYNMEKTPAGWVNIAANNIWDVFFIAYYVIYFLTSMFLLWNQGRQSNNPRDKKSYYIIILSFLTTTIVGSLTDILGPVLFSTDIPQLAPILIVIPTIIIYYFIRKYGLLNPEQSNEDAILMSDQIRATVSNYISAGFLFAAMVSFIANFFFIKNQELLSTVFFTIVFVLVAAIVQLSKKYIRNRILKDIILAALFSVIVPLIMFMNFQAAGSTVWAFAFALLVVSIIYDTNFVRIILSVSIVLSLVIMWVLKPEATVTISHADHMMRLGIFLTAIWSARFGSRILQNKLKENAEQLSLQKITTEISTEFISVNEQNLSKKIDIALSRLGNILKPDRIYIYIFDEISGKDILTCHGIWKNEYVSENNDIDKKISASNYPRLIKRIQVGNIITLSNISDFSSLAGDELTKILGSPNKAFVAMPIIIKNKVYGFFGVDSKSMSRPWSETQIDFFRIISLIFSAAFERIQQEHAIIELAYFDHLTKLPNRFLFRDRVSQMICLSERTNNTLAIMFLDLDAFKSINDSIGHDGGDALIIKMAEQITKVLRKSDTVARFGGDEFLIMLSNLPSTDVIPKIAEKILHIFDKPFVINEQEFFLSASAGISVYPYDGADADSLVKNADLAMYKAKELGKNRYIFCTDDMREEVLYKMRLTNNLFRVLDRKELRLYYQPQISTQSGKIIGAEALLRWFHPEYGLIMPAVFIPLTEQTGLISAIGDWVIKEACRQCKEWHDKGLKDICIAVNVSFLQLKHPKFVQRITQILSKTKLDAKYLELELTESTAVRNSDYILDVLYRLKEMGITISIDDFGTEYSSLSRLSSMPIDRIKLDMHFIHSIDKSEKQNAIIKSIIELSHILGLQVVAEGVETKSQLDFLTKHNSDIIQGFYFHRPIPPEEIEKLLENE